MSSQNALSYVLAGSRLNGQCKRANVVSHSLGAAAGPPGFPYAHPACSLDELELHHQRNTRCAEEVCIGGDVAKVCRAAAAAAVAVAVAVAVIMIMVVIMFVATSLFLSSVRHVSHGRAHLCVRHAGLMVRFVTGAAERKLGVRRSK